MNDTTIRRDFEEWFSAPYKCELVRVGHGYKLLSADTAWRTWQAATTLSRKRSASLAERLARDVAIDAINCKPVDFFVAVGDPIRRGDA